MKTRLLLLAALTAFGSFGQDYVLTREVALSAAADAVTIQQPASDAARLVQFGGLTATGEMRGAYISCSAECSVTLEHSGTAATATTATPSPLPGAPAAKTTAFVASDVGVGTVIGRYTIPASSQHVVGIGVVLSGPGTGKNVTLRVASMTGTVKYTWVYSEEQ